MVIRKEISNKARQKRWYAIVVFNNHLEDPFCDVPVYVA